MVLDRGVASSQVEVVLGRGLKQFHPKIAITAQAFGWQENQEGGRDSPDGPLGMLQRNRGYPNTQRNEKKRPVELSGKKITDKLKSHERGSYR